MSFTSSQNNWYLRIPLATFAQTVSGKCHVQITYLNTTKTQSNNVILGGQFFQEFYGLIQNDHSVNPPTQKMSVAINMFGSIYNPYIGNKVLPTGVNPF
jgi:hypothetical protein